MASERDKLIEQAQQFHARERVRKFLVRRYSLHVTADVATLDDFIAFALSENSALVAANAELKELVDQQRTPAELMEMMAQQQSRTAAVDAENESLKARLAEAEKVIDRTGKCVITRASDNEPCQLTASHRRAHVFKEKGGK